MKLMLNCPNDRVTTQLHSKIINYQNMTILVDILGSKVSPVFQSGINTGFFFAEGGKFKRAIAYPN